jgi:hypothetical protein
MVQRASVQRKMEICTNMMQAAANDHATTAVRDAAACIPAVNLRAARTQPPRQRHGRRKRCSDQHTPPVAATDARV